MAGKKIHHNAMYNLAGSVAPIVIAFLTVPIYIKLVGEARYGLISLIWLAFGYFGVFDLGLSRATAYRLSSLNDQPLAIRTSVFYTACGLNLGLGLLSAICFYVVSSASAAHFADNIELQSEIVRSLPWVALFFPVGLLGGVFAGCLQSQEMFLELNVQQSVGSIVLQTLPLLFFYYGYQDLPSAILGAVIARAFNVFWLGVVCVKWMYPAGRPIFRPAYIRGLFRYGGWITISDMISPILNGLDQMIIGATLGPKATAYYSVPFSMASKVLIIPASLNRAVFPRLATLDKDNARRVSEKSLQIISGVMALTCAPAIVLAEPALAFWINAEIASHSHLAASILLVGMWINSIGYIPWTLLQARGRPDTVAKIHALELLPFVALLLALISLFGLAGAAVAWCVRVLVDLLLQTRFSEMKLADLNVAIVPGLVIASSFVATFVAMNLLASIVVASLSMVVMTAWLLRKTDIMSYVGLNGRRLQRK
ncbi:flippase [Methylobacterium sp. J-048]|uniref:flippase n=1 Tax=Methylobacterium sp. J-048 TaxID=2836635 RepID=UPI001FBA2025|nr:flippase [Methylobacterium sp. J-048]MCJ2058271.1 flippase [Methylobacterium sp. J-048]